MKQTHKSYVVGRSADGSLYVESLHTSDTYNFPNATFVLGAVRYYLHFLYEESLQWDDDLNFEATELARQQLRASQALKEGYF